ncbi:MAG: MmgE/PrpD family protein [Candidatus Entotheonellia bacterium]
MDRTTELLSAYACRLSYDDLPPEVVHQVKRTVIDTLGCALGGFDAEPSQIARRLAGHVSSIMPSRILGTKEASAPDMSGFANGVMVRYLDCNDSYFSPGGGHPSDMIPAVLALADPLGRDGRTVITAIALAYEVFCRLSDQVVLGDLGWDQGLFSVIGAACGAGKALGLDQQAMQQAISLAIVPNLPLGVTRVGELSMWKGCAAASATRAGIFAAQLAEQGMTGPAEPFEAPKGLWEQAVGKLVTLEKFGGGGEPFRITGTSFKFFPSQIHTQGPIGLALELRSRVAPSEIASLRIQTYHTAVHSAATEPQKWDPQTRETADHSIPYLVAVALHDGAVTPASFSSARIQDPALRPLIGKMTIVEEPEFTRRFPQEACTRMEVTSASGQRFVAETAHPKGHQANPLQDAEVEAKFRHLSHEVLPEEQARAALAQLWTLEQAPDLRALFDALVVRQP